MRIKLTVCWLLIGILICYGQDSGKIISELERAADGLLYESESDYPFTPFIWENRGGEELSIERLLELTGQDRNRPVEIIKLDDLFRDEERYRGLVQVLRKNLRDIKVYRVGRINIDIYIIGKDSKGNFAGVATKAIET
jgi:hypothetical protein